LYIQEGVHPRVITDGFDLARKRAQEFLNSFKYQPKEEVDRTLLLAVAQTALRTKVKKELADQLAEICVDAIECIHREGKPIDLFMVEIQEMQHKTVEETKVCLKILVDN